MKNNLRFFFKNTRGLYWPDGVTDYLLSFSVANLSTFLDGLSEDGQRALLSSYKLSYELVTPAAGIASVPIKFYFGILQTNGVVGDGETSVMKEISILNDMTDDVFGFQRISNPKYQEPFWIDVTEDDMFWRAKGEIQLPQNILSLLNKESETERLQDIYLVGIFIGGDTGGTAKSTTLYYSGHADYQLKRNPIKIR